MFVFLACMLLVGILAYLVRGPRVSFACFVISAVMVFVTSLLAATQKFIFFGPLLTEIALGLFFAAVMAGMVAKLPPRRRGRHSRPRGKPEIVQVMPDDAEHHRDPEETAVIALIPHPDEVPGNLTTKRRASLSPHR